MFHSLVSAIGSAVSAFMPSADYDAAKSTTKRRPPSGKTRHEDATLNAKGRRAVISSARDVAANFAVAAWMVRKHLDYVASFNFQSQAGEDFGSFDKDLEDAVAEWSLPGNCHDAGLLNFDAFLRVAECCAVLEGDCGVMRLASGHIQGFEADLITTPTDTIEGERWYNGVRVAGSGPLPNRPVEYGLSRYVGTGGPQFDRRVPANRFHLHRYASRFSQYRGITPLTAGLNSLKDVYEGIDYGIAKLKVEQFFALAFYRDAIESAGEVDASAAEDGDGNETDRGGYKVNFGNGPAILDLDPGDKAEFLKSDSPGANSRDFLMAVVMVAMKALDLPYSFFDESFTNFFGSRAAWMHYNRSAAAKRDNLALLANWWFAWRLQLAVQRRELLIPRGLFVSRPWWEFVPVGMPWWDPSKEVDGDLKSIKAGLSTPQRIVRQRGGGDFYDNVREIAAARKFAEGLNVPLEFIVSQTVVLNADE